MSKSIVHFGKILFRGPIYDLNLSYYFWIFFQYNILFSMSNKTPLITLLSDNFFFLIIFYLLFFASYGRRFAFWTDEAKCLLEAKTQPLYRLKRSRSTTQDVPQHVQAVQDRTRTEEALVDCIVTSKGTEQHLVVLKWSFFTI